MTDTVETVGQYMDQEAADELIGAERHKRLVAFDGERVTFKWKDYRAKGDARYKLMTLDADEFIRRFLIHVLPDGFHRIRHYGLLRQCQ